MDILAELLDIPQENLVYLSENDQILCLVPKDWVRCLQQGKLLEQTHRVWQAIDKEKIGRYLAPSTRKVPPGWSRVHAIIIQKTDTPVPSLLGQPLCGTNQNMTLTELLTFKATQGRQNLWDQACSQYSRAPTEDQKPNFSWVKGEDHLRNLFFQLHKCPMIYIETHPEKSVQLVQRPEDGDTQLNISHPLVVIETVNSFIILHEYLQHTLHDCVAFSPAKVKDSYAKLLFVVYQVLNSMSRCHSQGQILGNVNLHDTRVDENLWVQVQLQLDSAILQNCARDSSLCLDGSTSHSKSRDKEISAISVRNNEEMQEKCSHEDANEEETSLKDLPSIVQKWVHGEMSNFDYLMVLNRLSGRRMGDPNHHPVIPWVMNFRSEYGGEAYRDLTKSKYRLNKGDHQLDLTYDVPVNMNPNLKAAEPTHTPHHVSDVLSDITYYIYKARCTPKPVLCAHVRSKWVPHEYPANMQRMQEVTPDECIPEFFTDPTIFCSVHPDLPDLAVPSWCSGPEDFVRKHREYLEGEYVSRNLHHWIDLTFGYKLSGTAAVEAKNVYLQLVDQHTHLANHGVVQLFSEPHPHRLVTPVYMERTWTQNILPKTIKDLQPFQKDTKEAKDKSKRQSVGSQLNKRGLEPDPITMPLDYNPLALLEQVEKQFNFSMQVLHQPPTIRKPRQCTDVTQLRQRLLAYDMQALGCLMVELFLYHQLRVASRDADLWERYLKVKATWTKNRNQYPRPICYAASIILQLDSDPQLNHSKQPYPVFNYPPMLECGSPPLTPDLLLHPTSDVIPFPPYFSQLYSTIAKGKEIDRELSEYSSQNVDSDQIRVLVKTKIVAYAKLVNRWGPHMGEEGLGLVVPYVTDMLKDPHCGVQAAWSLFSSFSQLLGPVQTRKELLPLLTKLFDSEDPSPKHIKLYHRTFIIQLIVRLGLQTFLANFSTLLVEAVACYRNFAIDDDFNRQVSNESEALQEDPTINDYSPMEDQASQPVQESDTDRSDGEHIKFDLAGEENETEPVESDISERDDMPLDNEAEMEMRQRERSSSMSDHPDDQEEEGGIQFGSFGRSAGDGESVKSAEPSEDLLSKSQGKVSVHSISRLMSEDKDKQSREMSPSSSHPRSRRSSGGSHGVDIHREQSKSDLLQEVVKKRKLEYSKSLVDSLGTTEYNINDVAAETIKWLAHRLGPLLTGKYLARNLLRVLALCYLGEDELEIVPKEDDTLSITKRHVLGDYNASQVLECLSCVCILYGEHLILLQYFPHIIDLISGATKKLTAKTEAGLIGNLVLVIHMIPFLSESSLMDCLQETIFREIILPVLDLVKSPHMAFPSGAAARRILCYKVIDLLHVIGLRIGRENTRQYMGYIIKKFFLGFSAVHREKEEVFHSEVVSPKASDTIEDNLYFEIKMDQSTLEPKVGAASSFPTGLISPGPEMRARSPSPSPGAGDAENGSQCKELCLEELEETFTAEMAHLAYIPLCRLAGGFFMEKELENDNLIRNLLAEHDLFVAQLEQASLADVQSDIQPTVNGMEDSCEEDGGVGFGNVSMSGNKIMISVDSSSKMAAPDMDVYQENAASKKKSVELASFDLNKLKNPEMEINTQRHLKGNWLAYWEHEMGLSDRDKYFNFKQIKLQTFVGHSNSVRSLYVLDNENSFISASKDKTVKLWSLRNFGDGGQRVGCQWTYGYHKKSVFAVTFLDSTRLAASCDSTVHIWDPFMGMPVRQLDSQKYSPVTMVTPMPAPNATLVTATTDSTIRLLDVRTGRYMNELRCTTSPAGLIRSVAVSPDNSWLVVGYSTGVLSVLDIRTGLLMASWKGHEGEVLQIRANSSRNFVTSSFDQSMVMWNVDDNKPACHFRGPTEPVHCFSFYRDEVVSATTANKIGVHSGLSGIVMKPSFSSCKLRSETFRGVLTAMAVLPLNRMLLLGADNGTIKLLC